MKAIVTALILGSVAGPGMAQSPAAPASEEQTGKVTSHGSANVMVQRPQEAWKVEALQRPIRAFCVDFNWQVKGNDLWFAAPGHWADADPAAQVEWCKQAGVNCIQTFVLSCNGYAWYKGGPIPEQPGLKCDFLTDVAKLGHRQKMLVMGYYCIGANSLWGKNHPDQSYGTPSAPHVPLTGDYLDYLCGSVTDSLGRTEIDGFMLDWLSNTSGKWFDCEKKMYEELMARPFPGADKVTPADKEAFDRKAVERCWTRIRDAARKVKPGCILWPNGLQHMNLEGVDWLLNESPDVNQTAAVLRQIDGKRPVRIIQNQVGWPDHDARKVLADSRYEKWDLYGFAAPYDNGLPLPVADYLNRPMDEFKGSDRMTINDKNIAALTRFYLGKTFDAPGGDGASPKPGGDKAKATSTTAGAKTPAAPETPQSPKLKWFDEAKYGLFINWGLYSIPAGEWQGKKYPNIGEWIMHDAKIPVKEYEQLAKQFKPSKFNAEEWVKLAVDAGMKYLVFDCKHHDGFALYHSAVSNYNCHDATPWLRDPMKELREACDRHGIKLCFYYSQATDWHEPNGANNNWDFPPNEQKDFDQYLRDKSLPQVKELLTNYGPIGLIWFDVPTLMTPERSKRVADLVRSIQPDTLINSRLGPGGFNDYQSRGDNEIPHTVTLGAWETAATVNDTWGYKKDDHHWKAPVDICFKLVDIVSKGGNYLLNVGPDGDGFIPQPSQDILREVGAWLKVNGEAIYGAGRTPFGAELGAEDPGRKDRRGRPLFVERKAWRCTTKPGRLYFHFFEWPGASFELPTINGKVRKACLLGDGKPLERVQDGGKATVRLPATAPAGLAAVMCLELEE